MLKWAAAPSPPPPLATRLVRLYFVHNRNRKICTIFSVPITTFQTFNTK